MPRKKTNEEFIQESIEIYGNQFEYLSPYMGTEKQITLKCSIHGEFTQFAKVHLRGHGCPKCTGNSRGTTSEFISDAISIHGNLYDYSKVDFINRDTDVVIICKEHGEFEMNPRVHIRGAKCTKCTGRNKPTTEEFIMKSRAVHGETYDYSNVVYGKNNKEPVEIICPTHGPMMQRPNDHLSGKGCKFCSSSNVVSRAVSDIEQILDAANISYEREKTFTGCKNIYPLRFDFYIPNMNLCIEYDGAQHFEPVPFWGGEEKLKQTKYNDQLKNEYCRINNIKLIRIKYTQNHKNIITGLIKTYESY